MQVLLTGASGFVGNALAKRLINDKKQIRAAVRRPISNLPSCIDQQLYTGLTSDYSWTNTVQDIEVVIHCAARVHVMNDNSTDPLSAFRKTNVEGTLNLARQAAAAGAKRFIFLSSIKVNGESTSIGHPFNANNKPSPIDPYGTSKMEAELGLRELSRNTGIEIVIIRPVLIYGPGVKANFKQLVGLVAKGIPLPLANTTNKRSLVALDNLVDLVATCIDHPAASNQTFLVSDGEDLSTAELIRKIARSLDRRPQLIPFPLHLLKLIAFVCGKKGAADRLLATLQVDIQHTCDVLAWQPIVSVDYALQETVDSLIHR